MEADVTPKRRKLLPGSIVRSVKYRYTIQKLLGSGGFGDVYLVDNGGPRKFAMKTEFSDKNSDAHMRLRMEVKIISECAKAPLPKRLHFAEYLDRGITPLFKFLVMGVVGPSITRLRKEVGDDFDSSTSIRVCQQSLAAIQDLHDVGYIHRDIKMDNFCIGLNPPYQGTIYILDFGISRPWCDDVTATEKVPSVPRRKVAFIGTTTFAPRAAHKGLEQGRKDDLESWLYMCLDVFDDVGPGWKAYLMPVRDEVKPESNEEYQGRIDRYMQNILNGKEAFMKNRALVFRRLPKEFKKLCTYVDKLAYADCPDYEYMHAVLDEMIRSNNIDIDKPFDWQNFVDDANTKNQDEVTKEKMSMHKSAEEEDKALSSVMSASFSDRAGKRSSKRHGKTKKRRNKKDNNMTKDAREAKKKKDQRRREQTARWRMTRRQEMKERQKKERERLRNTTQIPCEGRLYEVVCLLNSGTYGDVYMVDNKGEKYALKTESKMIPRKHMRLGAEKDVLMELQKAAPELRRHFPSYVNRGITGKFKFLLTDLVGPTIDDIRHKILNANFSRATAFRICEQSLAAVKDLHQIGYLHRDVKPGNLCVGVAKGSQDTVYLMDFGIARKYLEEERGGRKKHVPQRKEVKFRGTVRFCSRACHKLLDQGRKDDLESWIYTCIDVFNDTALPWKKMEQKSDIAEAKEKFFKSEDSPVLYPKEMRRICQYVNKLKFSDEPDYAVIEKILCSIRRECTNNFDLSAPLDWANKIREKKDDEDSCKTDNLSGSGSGKSDKKLRRTTTTFK